jgi:hypothetical protein
MLREAVFIQYSDVAPARKRTREYCTRNFYPGLRRASLGRIRRSLRRASGGECPWLENDARD